MKTLPRYFPPGYFDKWFWVCLLGNAGMIGYDLAMLYADASRPGLLAIMAGACALQILVTARFVRMTARHSREWRAAREGFEMVERELAEIRDELKRRGVDEK